MADEKASSKKSSSTELDSSLSAFGTAFVSIFRGLWHFLHWFWLWVWKQHPFIQAIISIPITVITIRVAKIFAEGIYSTFWAKAIPINGSLYVTGLPVPISIAMYFLLTLLIMTMLSNHQNRKEIKELRKEIESDS